MQDRVSDHRGKRSVPDERSDLALIKIHAGRQFSYVKFADRPPQVGDWAVAVGKIRSGLAERLMRMTTAVGMRFVALPSG